MSLATDLQGIETKTGTLETDLGDIKNALTEKKVFNVANIKISEVDERIKELNPPDPPICKQYIFQGIDYTTNVVFTDQKAPIEVATTDFSAKGDGSVVRWMSNNTTYISTQVEGLKVGFPSVCSYMFGYKTSTSDSNSTTTSIDFSNVDTSNVTDMYNMFFYCKALTTLDLSSFDTSSVRDMNSMFYRCEALTTLDLSSFNTSSITKMNNMFYQCTELTTLNLSSFDTSSVTNMYNMFYNCKALTTLDLSNFDTSSVVNMKNMFYHCEALTTLNLSSFDTSSVTNMSSMFYYCLKLSTIYTKEWNKISSDSTMFGNCSNLPNYNSSKQDGSMAKWVENGGYFTKPNTWEINKPDIIEALTEKNITVDDSLTLNEVSHKIRLIKIPAPSAVYGVKITESTSDPKARVQYTDDAVGMTPVEVNQKDGTVNYHEWDYTWIFEKIYPVMLKTSGVIDYKLDPNDYSQKLGGGNSDVGNTSYNGNAMVCVEKFYTKFSMSGSNECIQISDLPKDGFEAIGFIREDGSEADRVFLPMFMGSYDSNSKLRSLSGQTIKYDISWTDFRTAAQKNGSGYDIETWAMNQMFQAVYYILMKNCNPQTALGDGRRYLYAKTGTLNNKGPIAYDPTTQAVKFMHVEDFTSNYSDGMTRLEAGILCKNKEIYVRMKPPYSGTDTSTYEKVSDHVYGTKYMSKMKCSNKYGRYAVEYSGSASTYESSYWYENNNTSGYVYVSVRGISCGVAGRNIGDRASYTNSNMGAALSFVPPA